MTPESMTDQLFELVRRFIHQRPKLVVPEHVARFKKQMEDVKLGGATRQEDRAFIFRIFIILERRELALTMGELSTELGVPLSTATRIVDELVDANFIERVNDVRDRRVVRVQMTENGRKMYQSAMDFNKQRVAHIMSKFTPEEQSQLLYLMNKLLNIFMEETVSDEGVTR
jgi:DNA-binding MarR family transcriptional regulator